MIAVLQHETQGSLGQSTTQQQSKCIRAPVKRLIKAGQCKVSANDLKTSVPSGFALRMHPSMFFKLARDISFIS
jgi:hypothetical protein